MKLRSRSYCLLSLSGVVFFGLLHQRSLLVVFVEAAGGVDKNSAVENKKLTRILFLRACCNFFSAVIIYGTEQEESLKFFLE